MKACGYVRVSTEEQRDGVSIDLQKEKIRLFCQAKDWELIEIYRDEGKSGKDLKRADMQRLITDAQLRQFEAVIVYKVDRLSRRQRDLWHLLDDVFEPNGVGFVSVNEPFDTTTAIGKACLGMIGVFAQLERDMISERTKDALSYKKRQGDRLGTPPLGFSLVGDELKEQPEELAAVHYAKQLRREGFSLRDIANHLDEAGHKTKRGGKWHRSTVRYLLNNQIYASV